MQEFSSLKDLTYHDEDIREKAQLAVMYLDVPRPPKNTKDLRRYLKDQTNTKTQKVALCALGDPAQPLYMVPIKQLKTWLWRLFGIKFPKERKEGGRKARKQARKKTVAKR